MYATKYNFINLILYSKYSNFQYINIECKFIFLENTSTESQVKLISYLYYTNVHIYIFTL